MRIPGRLLPHTVSIRALAGHGAGGPIYDAPVTVRAYIEDKQSVAIDGTGQEVPSTGSVWIDPDVGVPPLSLVTVWAGTPLEREDRAVAVDRFDHPSAPAHQVLHLG